MVIELQAVDFTFSNRFISRLRYLSCFILHLVMKNH